MESSFSREDTCPDHKAINQAINRVSEFFGREMFGRFT